MKIYTRTGDKGETGLYGGKRVSKTDIRITTCGELDEFNAALGLAESYISSISPSLELPLEVAPMIQQVQRDIFDIGAHIATPYTVDSKPTSLPVIRPDAITWLEDTIDRMDDTLPELKMFILPGGGQAGAMLHVARTICRRSERSMVQLATTDYVDPFMLEYINRLSDFLFNLARIINQAEHKPEIYWKQ